MDARQQLSSRLSFNFKGEQRTKDLPPFHPVASFKLKWNVQIIYLHEKKTKLIISKIDLAKPKSRACRLFTLPFIQIWIYAMIELSG